LPLSFSFKSRVSTGILKKKLLTLRVRTRLSFFEYTIPSGNIRYCSFCSLLKSAEIHNWLTAITPAFHQNDTQNAGGLLIKAYKVWFEPL